MKPLRQHNQQPASDVRQPRDRILDTAEELFAEHGYFGVTMRDITKKASVDVALPRYHFGSKDEMFETVIARRAAEHCGDIIAELENAERKNKGRPLKLESIIAALLLPGFRRLEGDDDGWRNYVRLISHLRAIPQSYQFLKPMHRYYKPLEQRYIKAFRQALPKASEEDIYWSFYFLDGAAIHAYSLTEGVEALSGGVCKSNDLTTVQSKIVPFLAAGFRQATSAIG